MSPWGPGLGFIHTHILTGEVGANDGVGRVVGVVVSCTEPDFLHFLSLGLSPTVTHSHNCLGLQGDWCLGLLQIFSRSVVLRSLVVPVLLRDFPSNFDLLGKPLFIMLFVLLQLKWHIANISTCANKGISVLINPRTAKIFTSRSCQRVITVTPLPCVRGKALVERVIHVNGLHALFIARPRTPHKCLLFGVTITVRTLFHWDWAAQLKERYFKPFT